ncbi:MAG: hypothetical protein SGILL_007541 [Bacillariaceae sp.]
MSSTTLTDLLVPTYKQNLQNLSKWLEKAKAAAAVASDNDDDGVTKILSRRLAPDMFPLATQVRFVCYQAQESIYRIKGEEIPAVVHEIAEEGRKLGSKDDDATPKDTFESAQARISEALAFLDTLQADSLDQDGSATRMLVLELPGGTGMTFDLTGEQFARDWALPQFYFHTVVAYSILRGAGVELGKADYVPHMFAYMRPPAESV